MTKAKEQKIVELPDFLTVRELADLIDATPIDIIKELMSNGIMASINQQIDYETAAIVVAEMGYEARPSAVEEKAEAEATGPAAKWRQVYEKEDPSELVARPPVVTFLGHVDHGKTSLLDKIRVTNVQEGEAGGITQHIGAYQVNLEGRKITFLDTPGHEAFTEMRARGAQGADIVVLVVAADDGVMPQTREALAHARAARVPIVVALNKIDRSNANPERVKQELADIDLVPDDWDGDTIVVPVSAITGDGIGDLLEAILLVAETTDIRANPNGNTMGTVLESQLERGRGSVATLLVQNGTLQTGDAIVAGTTCGRIKAMFDENGNPVTSATPSTPVQIMGLDELPPPGTSFEVVDTEREARTIAADRREEAERATVSGGRRAIVSLEDLYAQFQAGSTKELNLIAKVDVHGSIEPVVSSLERLSVEEQGSDLTVNILHAEAGNITESDVMLAAASGAVIVGFQVDVDSAARRQAEVEGVEIHLYDIIYKLIEDIEQALKGLLEPVYEDVIIGTAEVRQVFRIPKIGNIAGCYVQEGEVRRNSKARVVRDDKILFEGELSSLKRFQEDVREVRSGFECGVGVVGFENFEEGDIIQFTIKERVA
jgi:translation initiation factor IF-2